MKRTLHGILALLLAALMLVGSCGIACAEPEKENHLNVAMFMWMEGLDPAEGWQGWTAMRCGIGETLLTANENMEVIPWLADSWEQLDDVTYKFHIRQGVKFSNGNDMTPEIVKESIQRAADTNQRGGNLKLESIEVDGEYVIFKTSEVYSGFTYYLTEPMCAIVDTSVDMSNYVASPVCTGPYVCVDYETEVKYELVANEYYWGGRPSIDSITVLNVSNDNKVNAMLSGDIDVTVAASATTLPLIEGSDTIQMVRVLGSRENDLVLNCREGHPTADVNLRRALSCAIDREVVARIAGGDYSKPLYTPFPPSVGYNAPELQGQVYDVDQAREYLALAGYEDADGNGYVEKDGEELVLRISLSSSSSTAVFQAVQDMWKAIGVHAEIELLENISDIRASGDFDCISGGSQTVNNADGQAWLRNHFSANGTDNHAGFNSPAFEEVMARLEQSFEIAQRVECFNDASKVLINECPSIFMYANENIELVNTSKVTNVTVYPLDYYMITADWEIVK